MILRRWKNLKKGKKELSQLSQKKKDEILESIIDECITHAGDSYSDFARPVISLLVKNKLVEYGEPEE